MMQVALYLSRIVLLFVLAACCGLAQHVSETHWSLYLNDRWTAYDSATRVELTSALDNPGSIKQVCYLAQNNETYRIDLTGASGSFAKFSHWNDGLRAGETVTRFWQVNANDHYKVRPIRRVTLVATLNGVSTTLKLTWQIWNMQADPTGADIWLNGSPTRTGKWVDLESDQYSLQDIWRRPAEIYDDNGNAIQIKTLSSYLEYVLAAPQSHICFSQWINDQTGTLVKYHKNARFITDKELQARISSQNFLTYNTDKCEPTGADAKGIRKNFPAAVQLATEDIFRQRLICHITHNYTIGTPSIWSNANVEIQPKPTQIKSLLTPGKTINEYDVYILPSSVHHQTYYFDTKQVEKSLIAYFAQHVVKNDVAINDRVDAPKYFWHGTTGIKDPIKNMKLDQTVGPELWTVIMSPYSQSLDWAFRYTMGYTSNVPISLSSLSDDVQYKGFIAIVEATNPVTLDSSSQCHIKVEKFGMRLPHDATTDQVYARQGYHVVVTTNTGKPYDLKNPPEHPDAYIFPANAQKLCGLRIHSIFYLHTVESQDKIPTTISQSPFPHTLGDTNKSKGHSRFGARY